MRPIFTLFTFLIFLRFGLPATAQVQFTDQTESAGITFRHTFGGEEKKFILEAKGGGAAFFDADNDGDLDLYVVNGSTLETYRQKAGPGNVLYRNEGDGTFADITASAGVGDAGWGHGAAVGDIDNDGFRDLYVTNYGANLLYRNQDDGSFEDITDRAGVPGNQYSTSAAFFDADNDGDLDLYVAHYVVFDIDDVPDDATQAERCVFLGGVVYCGPGGMPGTGDVFYRNEGDGTFTDFTDASGISQANDYYGLGVTPLDYDSDGDLDIYVTNDATPNVLFQNEGDGTFSEVGLFAGVAFNGDGDEEAGMGVDTGDYDGDGDPDLHVAHFFSETNTLYRNEGDGSFTDATIVAGLAGPTRNKVGFASKFLDYDNDGDLDLFVANGHVYPHISLIPAGSTYRQPNQLFRNDGEGQFSDISSQAGPGLLVEKASRGACFGDYDNDGDIDIFVLDMNDAPTLLRNDGGDARNWLTVQVFGQRVNRDGVGTKIRLKAGDLTLYRTVNGASSYMSHSDIRAHFGLGTQPRVEQVELTWTDGTVQSIRDLPINCLLVVHQERGHAVLKPGANPYSAFAPTAP
jgi:enediyne biosynthesis protein E4